jgi:hypothetical protein
VAVGVAAGVANVVTITAKMVTADLGIFAPEVTAAEQFLFESGHWSHLITSLKENWIREPIVNKRKSYQCSVGKAGLADQ